MRIAGSHKSITQVLFVPDPGLQPPHPLPFLTQPKTLFFLPSCNTHIHKKLDSYKFVRLFPLNQYDLPTYNADTLSFQELNVDYDPQTNEDGTITATSTISFAASPSTASSQTALHMKTSEDRASQGSNPLVDYTPPNYITLLLTDLGVLTPSGVSDELIKLYL